MAANSKQGTYVGTTLAGFTVTVAGLVSTATHGVLGWIITLSGLALLGFSTVSFVRIKHLETGK